MAIFARDKLFESGFETGAAAGMERKVEFRALSKIPEQRRWSETKEERVGERSRWRFMAEIGGVEKEKRTFQCRRPRGRAFPPIERKRKNVAERDR